MICPKCERQLESARYAVANVKICGGCKGVLLEKRRVGTLVRRVNKNIKELVSEAILDSAEDSADPIRCPKCRNRMTKSLDKKLAFHTDECSNCDRVWLDGGELARMQLEFETKDQVRELNAMRKRLESMTPAERKEYEDRIANMPFMHDGGVTEDDLDFDIFDME